MNKKIIVVITVSFFFISGITYYLMLNGADKTSLENKIILSDTIIVDDKGIDEDIKEEKKDSEDVHAASILVHVCGAVKSPGVYSFFKGARTIEGIDAAGGFLEDADRSYLNLAEMMDDEQKIYVPTKEEIETRNHLYFEEKTNASKNDEQGRININTALVDKLMELPGIGIKKAENIIKYREANGLFKSTEEIIKVDGISETLYKNISDNITI